MSILRPFLAILLLCASSQLFSEQGDDKEAESSAAQDQDTVTANHDSISRDIEPKDANGNLPITPTQNPSTKDDDASLYSPVHTNHDTQEIKPQTQEDTSSIKAPPASLMWITVFVAFFTFIWRIYAFIVGRRDRSYERNISIEDEYWYRGVILPTCLEPLLLFVLDQSDKLQHLNNRFSVGSDSKGDEYKSYLEQFQKEKRSLVNRSIVLEVISSDVYSSVAQLFDDLEDAVTEHCAISSLGSDSVDDTRYEKYIVTEERFFTFLRDVYQIFVDQHRQIFPVKQKTARGRLWKTKD